MKNVRYKIHCGADVVLSVYLGIHYHAKIPSKNYWIEVSNEATLIAANSHNMVAGHVIDQFEWDWDTKDIFDSNLDYV